MTFKVRDLTGQVFERLTVLHKHGKDRFGYALWFCQCVCGNTHVVSGNHLTQKQIRSCGCLTVKHGHTRNNKQSSEYRTWIAMKQRCFNLRHKDFPRYGGRGISICEGWVNSFEMFLKDMGYRPNSMTLERSDNNGNYEPSNCTWATMKKQSNNRRSNRLIEFNGETMNVKQWSEKVKIPYDTLRHRLSHGWLIEKALYQPVRQIKEKP
jgi:hypothetical protein